MGEPREYQMDVYEVVHGVGIKKRRVWNWEYCDCFLYHESLEEARRALRPSQKPRVTLEEARNARRNHH